VERTDAELIDDYRRGSQAALAILIRRHVDLVFAVALRRTGDPGLADDVTQAVFIVLATKARFLRTQATVAGWLMVVTRHVASTAVRGRRRRRHHEQVAARPEAISMTDSDAVPAEMARVLDDALAGLSATDRDAVALRYLEGHSLTDVGRSLGISEEAARKRVARGVERLRKSLFRRGVAIGAAGLSNTVAMFAGPPAPATTVAVVTDSPPMPCSDLAVLLSRRTLRMLALKKTGVVLAIMVVGLSAVAGLIVLAQSTAASPPAPARAATVAASPEVLGHATRPSETGPTEITETFTAAQQDKRWDGWASDDRSIPGWGNKPPEPGTVAVVASANGKARTFSGRVDGLATFKGAEVGVVSLAYIYWNRRDTYHWTPVASDGTFSIKEDKYAEENKAVILRAPGHPWTFLSYIFKGNEGGENIVLHAEPGKAVRVTVELENAVSKDFGVEFFALNPSWVHANNPIGYQWASRQWTPDNSDGSLILYFPLHPIAVYIGAAGAASDWEIVDARKADHFHFVLLPAAHLNLAITKNGAPAPKIDVLMGNDNAALSLRGGETDEAGEWHAGGLAPGTWWLTVGKKTVQFDLGAKQTIDATYDLVSGVLSTNATNGRGI
jgi:RNA polymerase sigma factor (sigma-70 family)